MALAVKTRRSIISVLTLIAMLSLAVPASAAKPDTVREVIPYDDIVPASDNPCGLEIHVVGEVNITTKFFYDRAGNLTKITVFVNDSWTETGLPDGGTLYGSTARTYTETNYTLDDDGNFSFTSQWTGVPIKYRVPGLGVITIDAGNAAIAQTIPGDGSDPTVELLWENGQHPNFFLSPDLNLEWINTACQVFAG